MNKWSEGMVSLNWLSSKTINVVLNLNKSQHKHFWNMKTLLIVTTNTNALQNQITMVIIIQIKCVCVWLRIGIVYNG